MKKIILGLMLGLLAACGNPHLVSTDVLPGESYILPVVQKSLSGLELSVPGSTVKALELADPSSSLVLVTNLDNTLYEVSYSFEKGKNFRFSSNVFPGIQGTCRAELNSLGQCLLDIEFFAENTGFYSDSLKVTFNLKDDKAHTTDIYFTLRAYKSPAPVTNTVVVHDTVTNTVTVREPVYVRETVTNTVTLYETITNTVTVREPIYILETVTNTVTVNNTVVVTATVTETNTNTVTVVKEVVKEVIKEANFALIDNNSISMGELKVGEKVTKLIEINNRGNTAAQIEATDFSSSEFSFSGGSFPGVNGTCSKEMNAGPCLIEVTFSPTAKGLRTTKLKLSYDTNKKALVEIYGLAHPQTCIKTETVIVEPKAKADWKNVVLPFNTTNANTSSKLGLVYGTEANYRIDNFYTVRDAQVLVSYELPAIEGQIVDIKTKIDAFKVVYDNYKTTEMICLSTNSLKRCSGQKFVLKSWAALTNPKFFTTGNELINDLYEKDLVATEKKCGARTCMTTKMPISFADIFAADEVTLGAIAAEKKINLILSDDTRLLTMPRLEVTVKKETSCSEL